MKYYLLAILLAILAAGLLRYLPQTEAGHGAIPANEAAPPAQPDPEPRPDDTLPLEPPSAKRATRNPQGLPSPNDNSRKIMQIGDAARSVVKLLEAAKRQNKYQPVLEMILATQPQWADHGKPNIELAFRAAQEAGLDIAKAQADAQGSDIAAVLKQDIEDLTALEVTKTPTFFVNGRGLPSFGDQQLLSLVAEEVAKARK